MSHRNVRARQQKVAEVACYQLARILVVVPPNTPLLREVGAPSVFLELNKNRSGCVIDTTQIRYVLERDGPPQLAVVLWIDK